MQLNSSDVESVHLADWPATEFSLPEKDRRELMDGMAEIRQLASLGLAKRAQAKIKVRQPLQALRVANSELRGKDELLQILADEINVKEIIFDAALKEGVELDTTITSELREEGLLREVSRMVQELRQKAGLSPKDEIALMMHLPEPIQSAIVKNENILKSDVGAKSIEYKKSEKFTAEEETKIEGQEVWIGIRKV